MPTRKPSQRRVTSPMLLGALAVLLPAVAAASAPTGPDARTLLAAEDALFAADVAHDTRAIARGFADEAVFVHANGMIQTKADYIAAARHPSFPTKSVVGENRVVRIFGNIGIVRGVKKLEVGEMHLAGTYLSIYVWRDGRWQLLDQQSSPEFHLPKTD